jgi:hypothetical protein
MSMFSFLLMSIGMVATTHLVSGCYVKAGIMLPLISQHAAVGLVFLTVAGVVSKLTLRSFECNHAAMIQGGVMFMALTLPMVSIGEDLPNGILDKDVRFGWTIFSAAVAVSLTLVVVGAASWLISVWKWRSALSSSPTEPPTPTAPK